MRRSSRRVLGISLLGILAAAPMLMGTLRMTGRVIVPSGDTIAEDFYAFANHIIIEGVVDGDLIVVTSNLTITGQVTGDVFGVVGGPVSISGEVDGAVRLVAVRADVGGMIGDDLAGVVGDLTVSGSVGRDILAFGGGMDVLGTVGRDLRAQAIDLKLNGAVGRDVLLRADRLELGDRAAVGGDVLYKATRDAAVSPGAVVSGQFTKRRVITPIWALAAVRVFAVLSVLGFITAGLVGLWVFRGLSGKAIETAGTRPGRSALIGLVVLLAPPILVLPLFLTLVGIPIALVLLIVWLVALFLGPLPAVTAFGTRLIRGRGGAALGLIAGALVWRGAIWLLPLVATILYVGALVVGLGAFWSAAWSLRREHPAVA